MYDSTQYVIANDHIAVNVPCSDDFISSINVLLGQAPNLINAELENIPQLSDPGSMCLPLFFYVFKVSMFCNNTFYVDWKSYLYCSSAIFAINYVVPSNAMNNPANHEE